MATNVYGWKIKTYRAKHKGCATIMLTSAEGYEGTRLWARRMGTKGDFPLISFKAVPRDKRGRFK